jgi:3-dehydroquinate synthase
MAILNYDIIIEDGLLARAKPRLEAVLTKGEAAAIVSDENVWPLYGAVLQHILTDIGVKAEPIVLPPGEKSKDLSHLAAIYEALAKAHVTRRGIIIALGGGVVGDIAGFAAATWMRGIDYVQLPTTLLAQVDSSVGGKTAIDTSAGKNLVGAFWQPRLVLIDSAVLTTLPPREFRAGLGEVCKYGAACDAALFAALETVAVDKPAEWLPTIIHTCCAIKSHIVASDERDESGQRAILNFGHTFGHAIEKKYGFARFNHGEGVAAGMRIAARVGEALGVSASGTAARLDVLLDRLGLAALEDAADLLDAIKSDKKSAADGVDLILLKTIGEAMVYRVGFEELDMLLGKLDPHAKEFP